MEFAGDWRFTNPGPASRDVQRALWTLIGRITSQGERKSVLELFKRGYAEAAGATHFPSTSESWAESDLDKLMEQVADNEALYIAGFRAGCQHVGDTWPAFDLPDEAAVNQALQAGSSTFRIAGQTLVRTRPENGSEISRGDGRGGYGTGSYGSSDEGLPQDLDRAAGGFSGSAAVAPGQRSRGMEWVRALEQQGQELIAVAGRFLPSSSVDSIDASVREALENARQVAGGALPNPPHISNALPDPEFLPSDVASRLVTFYNLYSLIDPRPKATSGSDPSDASADIAGGRDDPNGQPMVAAYGPPQAGTDPQFVSTSDAVGISGQLSSPDRAGRLGGEVKSTSVRLDASSTMTANADRIPAEATRIQVEKVTIRPVDRAVVRQNLSRHGEHLVDLADVLLQQLDTILAPRRFGDNNPPIEDSEGHDLRPELQALQDTLREFRDALASAIVDPTRQIESLVESGGRLAVALKAITDHPLAQRPLLGLAAVGVSAVALAAGVPVDPTVTLAVMVAGPEGAKAAGDVLGRLGGRGT